MASGGEKKRRKLWKDEDMVAALESVKSKGLTVTQAASTYNVPRKTLDDQVWDTVLSPTEEKALCNYLVYMAERGISSYAHYGDAWAIAIRSEMVVVSTLNWVQGNIGGPGSINGTQSLC